MSQQSKHDQLGMNASTASATLLKDILFNYVQKDDVKCFRCNKPLTRETFSIDHKTPWLHSSDPVGLFFDLENISFSHQYCNSSASRRKAAKHGSPTWYKNKKCRCTECVSWYKSQPKKPYDPIKRKEQYKRTGK